jgi:hypothetical protein
MLFIHHLQTENTDVHIEDFYEACHSERSEESKFDMAFELFRPYRTLIILSFIYYQYFVPTGLDSLFSFLLLGYRSHGAENCLSFVITTHQYKATCERHHNKEIAKAPEERYHNKTNRYNFT